MKKADLTLKDRHLLFTILAGWKGGMDEMPFIADDVKAINITEDDWKKAKRVKFIHVKIKENNTEGLVNEAEFDKEKMELTGKEGYWTWDETKIKPISVEISDASAKYLKKILDEKSSKGELVLNDKQYIDLLKKIS